jgi:phospholipid/cholesterol/gamma-HCH transport system substrate-binding protein
MAKLSGTVTRIVVLVVVVAIVAVGAFYLLTSSDNKKVTARFSSAVGIYPGTPVKILGVNVGSVTSVKPTGGYVTVGMEYDSQYSLPAKAGAVEVANSLVSDRYIQLTPAYTGSGPKMASKATIPLSRTSSPAELDDIYSALNTLSVALGPKGANSNGALSNLVKVGAANLKGNGAALGNSIAKLSQAAKTLSDGRQDLFGTVTHLRRFTTALSESDAQVKKFNEQLAQVAGDLASERADLGGALQQLGLALDKVNNFVKKNAGKFHTDISGIREITGVLVKQKASINETLAIAPIALANIVHAYQPNIGVIPTRGNLSSLTDPGQLCGILSAVPNLFNGVLGDVLGPLTSTIASACTDFLTKHKVDLSKILDLKEIVKGLTDLFSGGLGKPVGG